MSQIQNLFKRNDSWNDLESAPLCALTQTDSRYAIDFNVKGVVATSKVNLPKSSTNPGPQPKGSFQKNKIFKNILKAPKPFLVVK